MSTHPFAVTRHERTYCREIDNHHSHQRTAKSTQQLEKHGKQLVLAQARQADAMVKLSIAQGEANSISRAELEQREVISRGIHDVVYAVENLGEDVARNTEAVNTLSGIVAHGLQQLSQQSARQHREALEIARNPVRAKAQELAQEAELERWSLLVERYEQEQFPIDLPDPVAAIKFRMEQDGLRQKDLEKYFPGKNRVSEILNRKRPLSIGMIRALHRGLGIPAEVLLREVPG